MSEAVNGVTNTGLNEATRRQIDAAHPERSTWLSANAGSGKTRVLTDRVARLLLARTPPENILCLTFTKAAASEMQNRLLGRLGDWAMLSDDALSAELLNIGVPGPIGAERLAIARRLFAGAVETPGGLKIQTIHSFCASVLRQFPLEAGVSPGFRELDEREGLLLSREVFDRLAEGDGAGTLADFARHCSVGGLDATLQELVGHADAFAEDLSEDEIHDWFGVAPGDDAQTVCARAHDALAGPVADLAELLATGTPAIRTRAHELTLSLDLAPEAAIEGMCGALLTKTGSPVVAVGKAVLKLHPDSIDLHSEIVERLQHTRLTLAALEDLPRTLALHRFGRVYTRAHSARKAEMGVLDFDDLIRRTRWLLSNSEMAAWVLFRLDGGIDHILVDEAQDTSPVQWSIIEVLAREFAAGQGARGDILRTLFVVGDRKQSIYSFQGADPKEFERMRSDFETRLAGTGQPLKTMELQHSFRSSPLILNLVDKVFSSDVPMGIDLPTTHVAFHHDLPGRIDLWPLLDPTESEALPEWHDPRDRTIPRQAPHVLADRIAARVAEMLRTEQVPDGRGGMRPMTAGDILILVRRRIFISDPLIVALKKAGVEIAGSDQIVLASELAVMDVISVLKVLVTPADDLSLAEALRSPLFGLSEADLYDLAQPRGERETLWSALDRSGRFAEAVEILTDLKRQTDYLRPFELIERLLIRHRGRQRLVARLGEEVEEALDAFVAQSLAFEATGVPSLSGFLVWHEADEVRIKRESETGGTKLRLMTVHGAKGLEAPVVILPDTADYAGRQQDRTMRVHGGQPVFRSPKARIPPPLADFYEAEARADLEESNRLLYVALTRARSWLIVCGAGKDAASEGRQACWHRLISEAATSLGARPVDEDGTLRAEFGEWPGPGLHPVVEQGQTAPRALPGWATRPAAPGPAVMRLLSPSRLGPMSHAEASGLDREMALLRGNRLHLLLETLPAFAREDWAGTAAGLLRQDGEAPLLDDEIAELTAEAIAVLTAPGLGWLFGPDSLAEVDVTARLPQLKDRIQGRIDRLARQDGRIVAVDFKSNRNVPETPEAIPDGILMQLGAYVQALGGIFPGQQVSSAVLWTRSARLMPVPNEMVLAALGRATTS